MRRGTARPSRSGPGLPLLALGLRVVFAYCLYQTTRFGYTAIWWSQAMAWTAALLTCYTHFFRGGWKKKNLVR